MENKDVKIRVVKSKAMACMLGWLGFEYQHTEEGYLFERTYEFDRAWKDVHALRNYYKKDK